MSLGGALLITGAAGFVGTCLQARLRATHPDATLHALAADITDRQQVTAEIRLLRPFACIHLAAIATVAQARQDPDSVWRVNLEGTLNLARAIMAEAPDCHFLHVSTADAYGTSFTLGRALDETAALAPINAYGASKAAADLAVGALAIDGLRAIRLRPFNHTGPGQSDAFVVSAFARQAARIAMGLQPPTIRVGDLTPERDFLDVRDVCAAYVSVLETCPTLPPGTILNLASGTPRRIGDVLSDILAVAGVEARIEADRQLLRPSDIPFACGDAGKARRLLGWTAAVPWRQTLHDIVQDWRGRADLARG
jgi:GDP-4-dehydro-6-deoxy-D-mannose reductase